MKYFVFAYQDYLGEKNYDFREFETFEQVKQFIDTIGSGWKFIVIEGTEVEDV